MLSTTERDPALSQLIATMTHVTMRYDLAETEADRAQALHVLRMHARTLNEFLGLRTQNERTEEGT